MMKLILFNCFSKSFHFLPHIFSPLPSYHHHHHHLCIIIVHNFLNQNKPVLKNQSSDDHSMPPPSMASNSYIQTSHTSPTHHMHHQHLNAAISYHQPMYQQQIQMPLQPGTSVSTNPIAKSNAPSTSVAINPLPMSVSTPSVSNYPEEFFTAQDFNELGQSEHYIYVTYPPELKRRLLERYGKEIYLMLLKKDFND